MDLKEWLCNWICPDYQVTSVLRKKNEVLENKLNEKGIPVWFVDEYKKYPFAKITYPGRPIQGHPNIKPLYDVRSFISEKDYVFQEEIAQIPLSYKGINPREVYDNLVLETAKYLAPKIAYVSDQQNYGFNEYWSQPQDTWALKQDDCEGSTNLFISFMLNVGIPYYLLRNCCGVTYSGGGHSTLYYFASDDKWHHIECTRNYFGESSVLELPLRDSSDNTNIFKVWFSFDSNNSFHKFTTDGLNSWKEKENNFVITKNEGLI